MSTSGDMLVALAWDPGSRPSSDSASRVDDAGVAQGLQRQQQRYGRTPAAE